MKDKSNASTTVIYNNLTESDKARYSLELTVSSRRYKSGVRTCPLRLPRPPRICKYRKMAALVDQLKGEKSGCQAVKKLVRSDNDASELVIWAQGTFGDNWEDFLS